MEQEPGYVVRPGWNVPHNGRDLRYHGGMAAPVRSGDRVTLVPPAR